jgi:hypothetical protein
MARVPSEFCSPELLKEKSIKVLIGWAFEPT